MPENNLIEEAMKSIDDMMGDDYCKKNPEVVAAIITSLSQAEATQMSQESFKMLNAAILSVQNAIKHKEMS